MKPRAYFTSVVLLPLMCISTVHASDDDSSTGSTPGRPALEIINASEKTLFLMKKNKKVATIEAKGSQQVDEAFLKSPAIFSWSESAPQETALPRVSIRGYGNLCEAEVCVIVSAQ